MRFNVDTSPDKVQKKNKVRAERLERIKPFQWKTGQSGNPKGRPPEKTLKEYVRDTLSRMSEEERDIFLMGIPKEVIWKMAEGDYSQTKHLTVSAPTPILGGASQALTIGENVNGSSQGSKLSEGGGIILGTGVPTPYSSDDVNGAVSMDMVNSTDATPSPHATGALNERVSTPLNENKDPSP